MHLTSTKPHLKRLEKEKNIINLFGNWKMSVVHCHAHEKTQKIQKL